MRNYIILRLKGLLYIDKVKTSSGKTFICGYHKRSGTYSVWEVTKKMRLKLFGVAYTKNEAIFLMQIMCRGILSFE